MPMGCHEHYHIALAIVLCTLVASALGQPNLPSINLPTQARGGDIITALGANFNAVAAAYGMSSEKLRNIAKNDKDIVADTNGRLLYACEGLAVNGSAHEHEHDHDHDHLPAQRRHNRRLLQDYPITDAFKLHSRPGLTKVIYLDFDGEVVTDPNWNGGQTINCPAYHAGDGTPASTKSLQGIIDIWRAVSEDFSMFEVDVTTENPGLEALRKTTSTDTSYGIHVVIGPCKYWRPDAGGVAYLGSFTWSTDTVVWAFTDNLGNGTPKYTWEAVSHEVGHSFNLYHDGVSGGSAYYSGHAGWAPIMGVGYYQPLSQWSKGEYVNASNVEDDLAKIASYVPYRAADYGNTAAAASLLNPTVPAFDVTITKAGRLTKTAEVDYFKFFHYGGNVTADVTVLSSATAPAMSDLNVQLELRSSADVVISTFNPAGLNANLAVTDLANGTYYLTIRGKGTGDPKTGYSDYGVLGQYTLAAKFNSGDPAVVPPLPPSPPPTPSPPPPTPTCTALNGACTLSAQCCSGLSCRQDKRGRLRCVR